MTELAPRAASTNLPVPIAAAEREIIERHRTPRRLERLQIRRSGLIGRSCRDGQGHMAPPHRPAAELSDQGGVVDVCHQTNLLKLGQCRS
jgi:hypothetical protein